MDNRIRLFCLCAIIAFADLQPLWCGEPDKINSAETARSAMEAFIRNSGKDLDKYTIYLADHPGLLQKTIIATVVENGNFMPVPPPQYVILADGTVDFLSFERLVIAYRRENVLVTPDRDMAAIATSLISLGDLNGTHLISTLQEVPGYDKNPLNKDLESLIRPPWQYTDKEGDTYWICYTYCQNQGWVKRYKFRFHGSGIMNPVDVLQLGGSIGDYWLPE
jgi:hypothetical protein